MFVDQHLQQHKNLSKQVYQHPTTLLDNACHAKLSHNCTQKKISIKAIKGSFESP